MEKVEILQGTDTLGEWNVKTVTHEGAECTAFVFSEVWAAVDREFNLPYSASLIKALIEQQGGCHGKNQKFFPTRDQTLSYKRNQLINQETTPPKTKTKRCSLIPITSEPVTPTPEQTPQDAPGDVTPEQTPQDAPGDVTPEQTPQDAIAVGSLIRDQQTYFTGLVTDITPDGYLADMETGSKTLIPFHEAMLAESPS